MFLDAQTCCKEFDCQLREAEFSSFNDILYSFCLYFLLELFLCFGLPWSLASQHLEKYNSD
jgi:hypothetical protein